MKLNIDEDIGYPQYLFQLRSERTPAPSRDGPTSANQGNWRALSVAVENLLKYTGFHNLGRRNCFDYKLVRNEVYLPDLPGAFDGYTILHLSDLHTDALADEADSILDIVKTVPCDLAVLTGDFSFDEGGIHYEPCLEALMPIVRTIKVKDGIFGILGNHDVLEMIPPLERMGVQMLLNEAVQLQRGTAGIVLAGVDDPHFHKCHDLQKALSAVTPEHFVILLSHSPEIAAEAARCGVDFYLCGHTHGGQICLPGGIPLFANVSCNRRYVSGNWKCGSMKGYTSRGIGFSNSAARFFCAPEITLHTLHSGSLPGDFYNAVEDNIGRLFNKMGRVVHA